MPPVLVTIALALFFCAGVAMFAKRIKPHVADGAFAVAFALLVIHSVREGEQFWAAINAAFFAWAAYDCHKGARAGRDNTPTGKS